MTNSSDLTLSAADGFDSFLGSIKRKLELRLAAAYPQAEENSVESTYAAMRYMLFLGDGGKRIRPALTNLACLACGGSQNACWKFAQAVEEIHTYTLIIDDIQDDSPMRRHQEACHIKFGINTALMAAMRLYERGLKPFHLLPPRDADTAREFLDLLHRGQTADLSVQFWAEEELTLENLQFIHSGKTSALLQLSLLGGAAAAHATRQQKDALVRYGYFLGLAFQARDDTLSAASTTDAIGKPAGADADADRLTYPRLFGTVDSATKEARRLADEAWACLADQELLLPEHFQEFTRFTVGRER